MPKGRIGDSQRVTGCHQALGATIPALRGLQGCTGCAGLLCTRSSQRPLGKSTRAFDAALCLLNAHRRCAAFRMRVIIYHDVNWLLEGNGRLD